MKNKTKEELIEIIEELENKLEIAQNDVDYWQCEYNLMEEENEKLKNKIDNLTTCNSIKDIDNFKFELSKNGLDSTNLLDFINNYLRYYN